MKREAVGHFRLVLVGFFEANWMTDDNMIIPRKSWIFVGVSLGLRNPSFRTNFAKLVARNPSKEQHPKTPMTFYSTGCLTRDSCSLAKLKYFTNLCFPEISGFSLLNHHLV